MAPLLQHSDATTEGLARRLAGFALSLIASSVLFAWLFNGSHGSVVPVMVLHTAIDAL